MELSDFKLNDVSTTCLTMATVRLLALDIAASPESTRQMKRKDFNELTSSLSTALPGVPVGYSAKFHGEFGSKYATATTSVGSRIQQAMIISELATIDPWTSKRMFSRIRIEDSVRRIALKELAEYFSMAFGDEHMNKVIDDIAIGPSADLVTKAKYAGVGAGVLAVGGLMLAGPLGMAIGAKMGLSGAAAYSAGIAAIGGGSIASGGLGMIGGTVILGSISGLIGGASTTVVMAAAQSNSSPEIEANKLKITLSVMRWSPETKDSSFEVQRQIESRIAELAGEESRLRSASSPDKAKIKEVSREQKILRSSLPNF